ncbi:MAG: type I-E CRISPR-associated endoribonuclease Cas2e [Acidobacteriota bacterium]|nr:type I-E CRISPR-associated endoribonuclease Cas2e [Acidobacteriota bacterium]
MIVLVTSAVSAGLRGELTRWLVEISPGVFVGTVSSRVREQIWNLTCENIGNGKATLIFPQKNEQRMSIRTTSGGWETVDFDGMTLIRRPELGTGTRANRNVDRQEVREVSGWSIAGRRRYYRNSIERRQNP